ncbi:MAG: hypothetical protein ACKVOI_10325 [Dongiaceae bacterium]
MQFFIASSLIPLVVIAGLDPATQGCQGALLLLDARVKPGHDNSGYLLGAIET